MVVPMIEPRSGLCTVTLQLPWEVAEALVRYWPGIIGPIQTALAQREENARFDARLKAATDAQCEANIVEFKALAAYCRSEVERRSNGPGQKKAILKQIAAERGVNVTYLERIMKAFPTTEARNGCDLFACE